MSDNYTKLVKNNLSNLYNELPSKLSQNIPAKQDGNKFIFKAFGKNCIITPDEIILDDQEQSNVLGIIISLYLLNTIEENMVLEPFKAYKDFPNSMPYIGAFTTHTEHILIPHTDQIKNKKDQIIKVLDGKEAPSNIGGDFSFIVQPLPKIALCYIFYEADEEFPASATCLFSNNAANFMPMDGLADVGEYTSKEIIGLI